MTTTQLEQYADDLLDTVENNSANPEDCLWRLTALSGIVEMQLTIELWRDDLLQGNKPASDILHVIRPPVNAAPASQLKVLRARLQRRGIRNLFSRRERAGFFTAMTERGIYIQDLTQEPKWKHPDGEKT